MKSTSTLLSDLARAVADSFPEDGDSSIYVPPVLVPTVSTPFATRLSSPNQVENSSFILNQEIVLANGPALNNNLALVVPGLWEFVLQGSYSADWAIPGNSTYYIALVNPSGTVTVVLWLDYSPQPAAAFTRNFEFTRRLLLAPTDQSVRNWTLLQFTPGAGVGQTNRFWVNLIANRLF